MTTKPDVREIEAFLYREVRLLDERRFEDWMALFDADGYYWAPAAIDQKDPYDYVSLFFDDKKIMATRIERLRHPRIHIQTPPSRTVHLVSNVVLDESDLERDEHLVSCAFVMLEYRPGHEQHVFGGRYQYRLRRQGTSFAIAWKRADLINCDSTFPALAVPF